MNEFNIKYILAISMVSAMRGLLLGYDRVVIGGAKPFYEQFFHISQSLFLQGWAMSSALLGCLIGALTSGAFSDRLGRKRLQTTTRNKRKIIRENRSRNPELTGNSIRFVLFESEIK